MLIFIIGMMGSGKTSIGKKLAKQLNYSFIDVDISIEEKEGKSINDLFELWGEEKFRLQEHFHLQKFMHVENSIISTGGGLACFHDNMGLMNKCGETLFLSAESSFLASRLKQGKANRPLIAKIEDDDLPQFIDLLLEKRNPYYYKAKHLIQSKDLKANDIIDLLKSKGLSF